MSEDMNMDGTRLDNVSTKSGPTGQYVRYNRSKYKKLRIAYNRASRAKRSEFKFADEMYNTDFAKYLIEYLDTRLSA